jgi:hypothetical protein
MLNNVPIALVKFEQNMYTPFVHKKKIVHFGLSFNKIHMHIFLFIFKFCSEKYLFKW